MIKKQIAIFLLYCLLLQPLYGEHDGITISVANWNETNIETLAIMIDKAANNRMSNQYDMSRSMGRSNRV